MPTIEPIKRKIYIRWLNSCFPFFINSPNKLLKRPMHGLAVFAFFSDNGKSRSQINLAVEKFPLNVPHPHPFNPTTPPRFKQRWWFAFLRRTLKQDFSFILFPRARVICKLQVSKWKSFSVCFFIFILPIIIYFVSRDKWQIHGWEYTLLNSWRTQTQNYNFVYWCTCILYRDVLAKGHWEIAFCLVYACLSFLMRYAQQAYVRSNI